VGAEWPLRVKLNSTPLHASPLVAKHSFREFCTSEGALGNYVACVLSHIGAGKRPARKMGGGTLKPGQIPIGLGITSEWRAGWRIQLQ
jgi:hypothetical protein